MIAISQVASIGTILLATLLDKSQENGQVKSVNKYTHRAVLQLEELRNDIVDLKDMYREQVDLLVSQV
jgi:hypothetical protein